MTLGGGASLRIVALPFALQCSCYTYPSFRSTALTSFKSIRKGMILDSDHNDFIMVCKRTVVSFPTASDVILVVQKQAPEVETSNQEGPPSYDDATENGPCSEDSFYFVESYSPFVSFFPRRCWKTETRRVKCSTNAYTASLAGISKHIAAINYAFSYGLQLYIVGTITHNPAVIHGISYGLQLY